METVRVHLLGKGLIQILFEMKRLFFPTGWWEIKSRPSQNGRMVWIEVQWIKGCTSGLLTSEEIPSSLFWKNQGHIDFSALERRAELLFHSNYENRVRGEEVVAHLIALTEQLHGHSAIPKPPHWKWKIFQCTDSNEREIVEVLRRHFDSNNMEIY